jgi:tetratricopeptide (TPR) repeat protein
MTERDWEQFSSIAAEALELETEQRPPFVAAACGGNVELRARIDRLLSKAAGGSAFLEHSLNPATYPRAPGERIGNYVLDAHLGTGGMGEVWSARRADGQFDQQVAVKLLAAFRNSPWHEKRFRQERQILAALDHPNIARLFDGGVTPDGSPYLAMELVHGERSDTYCASLAVHARLLLFEKVAAAVQYAHRNLVVHRDIKPHNILVNKQGEPKLLDFGIAQSLGLLDSSATHTGLHAFTPDYASPEQIEGKPTGTATDIYSLGVLLFEWLTGRKPYMLTGKPLSEVVAAVCKQGVPPANTDNVELDAILAKATRIDPTERYSTAADFAADIRRYLDGRPVAARPATRWYRLRKFAARNRMASAVTAIAAVLLLAASVAVLLQWREAQRQRLEAEHRFNSLRKLARSLMFDLHDEIERLDGSTKARRMIVSEALAYMDPLAQSASGDPSLQAELIAGYTRMGKVELSQMGLSLGDAKRARVDYDKAVALAERAIQESPEHRPVLEATAAAYKERGGMRVELQDYRGAAADFDRSIAINRKLGATGPLRAVLNAKGQALIDVAPDQAVPVYQELIAQYTRDHAADPKAPRPRFGIVTMEMNLGSAYRQLERNQEAEQCFRKSVAVGEKLIADFPGEPRYPKNLRLSYAYLAQMLTSAGRTEEAVPLMQRNLELVMAHDKDTGNKTYLASIGLAYADLGNLELKRKKIAEARAAYRQSITKFREAVAAMPDVPLYRSRLAMALHLMASTYTKGDCAACPYCLEGAQSAKQVPSQDGLSGPEKLALAELPQQASFCLSRCR